MGFPFNFIPDSTFIEYDFLINPNSTHQIVIDTNNIVWFGKYGTGKIIAFNQLTLESLTIPSFPELQTSSIWSLYSDSQNNKWICFDNGYIVKYSGDFPTSVEDGNEDIPLHFSLSQNYPNPFNPVTTIKYSIPNVIFQPHRIGINSGRNLTVTLKVFNVLGKEVATLVNEESASVGAGNYEVNFDASSLSSGVYFYKIQYGLFNKKQKK